MKKIKQIFHIVSYLQYPVLLFAIYYSVKPYSYGFEHLRNNINILFENYSYFLALLGIAFSFSTLQDTTKVSLNVEKKIWGNPKKAKRFLITIAVFTISLLIFGVFGYFVSRNENINQLSLGVIILGIGLISLLKTGLEIFENHQNNRTISK